MNLPNHNVRIIAKLEVKPPFVVKPIIFEGLRRIGGTKSLARNEGTYSKYASLDDKLDGFHFYLAYIKFGLGRTSSDTAHEIRDGHIDRDDGIHLVKRFDGEFPELYFKTFLQYCDITEEYYHEVIDSWRSPHLWRKSYGKWELINPIWKN